MTSRAHDPHEGDPSRRPQSVDDVLIERYIVGECAAADVVAVEGWERRFPADGRVVEWLRERVDGPVVAVRGVAMERVLAEFARRVATTERSEREPVVVGGKRSPRRRWNLLVGNSSLSDWSSRPAPAVWSVVALATSLVCLWIGGTALLRTHSAMRAGQIYVTQPGQRTTITLRDGSHVSLAPQSTLTIPSTFGGLTRTVSLSGEAYFDVETFTGAPFVVQTSRVFTQVLGTTFNIRHYDVDGAVQVAVRAGKVMTHGLRTVTTISAGQAAQVTDSTAVMSTVTDLSQYTDWAAGQLVFKRTPVSAILATVGRWYGYTFRFSDSVAAAEKLTLSLNISDIEETMTDLKALLDVDLAFSGNVVTLTPRHQRTPRSAKPTRKDLLQPSLEMGR